MSNDTDTKIMLCYSNKPQIAKALVIIWFIVWRAALGKICRLLLRKAR